MKTLRMMMLTLAAVSVSACAGPQMASRNATLAGVDGNAALSQPVTALPANQLSQMDGAQIFIPDVAIAKVSVDVPRTLSVSEKNSYYPKGDIVWRGDMYGDRYEQVEAILTRSAQNAAGKLQGSRPVHMHIQVTRFHGLSEKARYSTGGVHNMNFLVTLLDPVSGATLRPAREVVSNLDALKGSAALEGERRGETQKTRVTAFLEQVLMAELTQPAGYQDNNTGFFVALNKN
ncbi:DUF6778 family protein [Planktotalea arctica]|uniref:DUF6778 family protein n=1 Tax=Planktotalea arctica TaxID=1481893 RepID=UPI00111C9240|nr:DUF6778 family protein [Planktotalea arctica]